MKRPIKLLLAMACLFFSIQTKADSWRDPSWKEMLDESDIIALVQYTNNGDFRASAKILTVYKGQLKAGDEIWISGFSNRYGPIDKMNKGDTYLVFINLDKPDKEGIEYYNKELKTKPNLKDFVKAFKDSKAYRVWTPSAGDLKVKDKKVQYDLTGTTFYRKQNYYLLNEFESFLSAYFNKDQTTAFCNKLLSGLKPVSEDDLKTQHLMKLFLLGNNKYDTVFESYVRVNNPYAKYALAQLMGNIKSESSRNILIALLDDKNSPVQGEAVRQLKSEPAEIVAPILLKHLHTSSEINFGPSNVMDPVMNRVDGGKAEILNTLGTLKYKPAIPDLLLLLDTKDNGLFNLVIEALKSIGSREYISYINKHLENKTGELIFDISMMIAKDSLTECLPGFKNFISTCDRNVHPNYEYTVSTCCGIGHFKDSTTISFLLSDYNRFFTYKDTLESGKQKDWTKEYIETFTDLKVKEARPLIYRSIYDWFGLNEDFGRDPNLFKIKKKLEDSLKKAFTNGLGKKGYELDNCIAFIENTNEVINGIKPKVKYLVQVSIPSTENGDQHEEIVVKELNIPKDNVFIRFSNGVYYISIEKRFEKSISFTPIDKFLGYAEAVPDQGNLVFLQGLLDNNFTSDEYDIRKIKEVIEKIKSALK